MWYNINELERRWHEATFLMGAFGDTDFDEFLDDPECGVGNQAFDQYADEINDYLLPCDVFKNT